MPSIVIIDDRKDMRETLKAIIEAVVEEGWNIIDMDPLPNLSDYIGLIKGHNVAVMVVDERLSDQATFGYQGHDLVAHIRNHLPTLPIFVVTSYPDDLEINERFKDVEEILGRELFVTRAEEYVARLVRAGQRFVEVFEEDLAELSDKAQKLAKGEATEEDVKRIKAIHSKMDIVYSGALEERNQFLEQMEQTLSELTALKQQVEEFLKT